MPRYCRTRSGCSFTASENEQKMTPFSLSFALNVVATETLSKTASTATPGEPRPLVQRHPELLVGLEQLRVHLVEALRAVLLLLRRRVVRDRLVVDRRVVDVRPGRLVHREPVPVGLEPPLGHPVRLALLRRDEAHDVLGQAGRQRLLLDVGDEAGLVLGPREVVERRCCSYAQPINLYRIVKITAGSRRARFRAFRTARRARRRPGRSTGRRCRRWRRGPRDRRTAPGAVW